jgi:hypothetical protein
LLNQRNHYKIKLKHMFVSYKNKASIKQGMVICQLISLVIFGIGIVTNTQVYAQENKKDQDTTQLAADEIKIGESVYEKLMRDPRILNHDAEARQGWIPIPAMETSIRFGGFVQVNYIHDFQNTGYPYGDFIPSLIPVPTDKTSGTQFDPRTSRITFETQTPTKIGSVSTFFSFDLATSSAAPRLRQAYVSWTSNRNGGNILLGQSWTTMIDLGVWPELFDLEGPNAMTGLRQVVLRYSFTLDKSKQWIAAASIEQPETNVQNGTGLEGLPDLAAKITWKKDWGHLGAAGILRQLIAESTANTNKDQVFGWGLSLSGNLKIPGTTRQTPKELLGNLGPRQDNFKFQLAGGHGIGRYVFDLGSAPEPQDAFYNNELTEIRSLNEIGAFGAYQHWWTDRWRSTIVGGWLEKSMFEELPSNDLKQSTYAVINLIYRPFNRMDVGIEYYWGQRTNKDGQSGEANRLLVGVNYIF